MPLPRHQQGIEPFVGPYERINHPDGVGRVDVAVHVAGDQQEFPFQVLRQLRIALDVIGEGGVAGCGNHLLHPVVALASLN